MWLKISWSARPILIMKVKACTAVNSSGGESSNPHLSPEKTYHVISFDNKCFRDMLISRCH